MAAVRTPHAPAHPHQSHGKLHKRNLSSDTSSSFPTSPPTATVRPSLDFLRRVTTHDDGGEEPSVANFSLKSKTVFRKLSSKDGGLVDLSRPAAENKGLAGLGIAFNDYGNANANANAHPNGSDLSFSPVHSHSRSRHIRSPSNSSDLSIGSFPRPNPAYYAHPMRHAPAPTTYTPPTMNSYTASLAAKSSEEDVAQTASGAQEDDASTFGLFTFPSPSATPKITARAPLRMTITDSVTPVTRFSSPSQTSLHTLSKPPAASVQAHVGRAATIQRERAAYKERQDAKMRKVEKEEMRQQERERKRHERVRQKSEASGGTNTTDGVDIVGVKEYAALKPVNSRSMPKMGAERVSPRRREWWDSGAGDERRKNGARRAWQHFVAWIRTRILRVGRKVTKPRRERSTV